MNIALVTGGRRFANPGMVDSMMNRSPIEIDLVLVGGCLTGVDEFVRRWAVKNEIPHLVVPARWRFHGPKAAGPIRNSLMADIPDTWLTKGHRVVCLSFPGETGTADMTAKAQKRFQTYVVDAGHWSLLYGRRNEEDDGA